MQIDVIVIKKRDEDTIHKNIGQIFKKYNIIEYKGPTDYLSIDNFYKVYGYTCFYKSTSDSIDNIKITDLTITFVCNKFPTKLAKHLSDILGFTIDKIESGIYYIGKDIIPIQLLVTSELSEKVNLWLRSLTNDLTSLDIINKLSREYSMHQYNELYKSMMNIITRANKERFKEVMGMCEALKELWADDIEQSRNEGIRCTIDSCKELGGTEEQIHALLVKNYKITEEEAEEYMKLYW